MTAPGRASKLATLRSELDSLKRHNERLLSVVLRAYRKQSGDESIGWDELRSNLCDAICNEKGSEWFCAWIDDLEAR